MARAFLKYIDPTKAIANHVIGHTHTMIHRKFIGVLIIATGVAISHLGVDISFVRYFFEAIGTSLHAIGFAPFLNSMGETNHE